MSQIDKDFLDELDFKVSEFAELLEISRQAAYKGLKSETNYLTESRLQEFKNILSEKYPYDPEYIESLIDKYYPDYYQGKSFAGLKEELPNFSGDVFILCKNVQYSLEAYHVQIEKMFAKVRTDLDSVFYFVFQSNYKKRKFEPIFEERIKLRNGNRKYLSCPFIQFMPFTIAGKVSGKPVSIVFEGREFMYLSSKNSADVVLGMERFIDRFR